MTFRRAIYAARFLRPPGWTKRLILREKPRELTGPYENPVRRWVRLREKARLFAELPPPRKVPVPKAAKMKPLQAVEGVPKVSPAALEKRLEFLLSPLAAEQQLSAPLLEGISPFNAEYRVWLRQMRDLRRIYRAQYLQKLAEVTEVERQKEAELHRQQLDERRKRKQAHLHRVGEDMKRRAILKDRKRIESKVTEAMEMAKRSKRKRQLLYWYRRMENLSKLIVSSDNFEDVFGASTSATTARGGAPASASSRSAGPSQPAASGVLVSRNVSVPFLLRQLGGATGFPLQKTKRIPQVDNIHRELLESSYDFLPEDSPRFEPAPAGPSSADRAVQLYGGFSEEEKMALLDTKIAMVRARLKQSEDKGEQDLIAIKLMDELEAARVAAEESAKADALKESAKASRGVDPPGLPSGRRSYCTARVLVPYVDFDVE
eukprot:TRINITY_DN67803_c0_g1_i1.p1 TRINITY_DN67803_c0_g1~~TRINITY_DN67803_c0_g1_i1.p1  ORF type:complete len:433 (+),score=76.57 TRINITY_DN67803_c0_g1_i1:70-1368(+)